MFGEASLEVEQAAIAREQRAVRDIMSMLIAKGLTPLEQVHAWIFLPLPEHWPVH